MSQPALRNDDVLKVEENRKEIVGWCMFDVANSSYTTIIITVAFNVVFAQLIVGPDAGDPTRFSHGNFLWSLTLVAANFLTAFLGPLFGALTDLSRRRKLFLAYSVGLCSGATALLYAVGPGDVALAIGLMVVSNLGFSLSENFISAFLPHIAPPEKIGKLSGLAWGLGYFGGLGSIFVTQALTGLDYTAPNFERLRLIGPATALFFVIFSIPTFLFVREPKLALASEAKMGRAVTGAYRELIHTIRNLHLLKDLARFLGSMLMFQAGLSIVISFAALYGAQAVGIEGAWQAIFFVTLQLTAAAGAISFGYLQARIGALRAIDITLVIWIVTILLIYFLKDVGAALGLTDLKLLFVVIGNFAGFCLGATQSSARALVAQFAPKARSGEIFGLWGFAGKLAAVIGIFLFGWLQTIMSLETAMLMCSLFFVGGLIANRFVDEGRGRAQAQAMT